VDIQHKPFDDAAIMFDEEETNFRTVATHDSAAVDLGGDDMDQDRPGEVLVVISKTFAATATATITLALIDCDTLAGSYAVLTPVQVTTAAIAKADIETTEGEKYSLPIPRDGVRQFLKLRCIIGTAAVTAGSITAGVLK
jgi:hypothetical protein